MKKITRVVIISIVITLLFCSYVRADEQESTSEVSKFTLKQLNDLHEASVSLSFLRTVLLTQIARIEAGEEVDTVSVIIDKDTVDLSIDELYDLYSLLSALKDTESRKKLVLAKSGAMHFDGSKLPYHYLLKLLDEIDAAIVNAETTKYSSHLSFVLRHNLAAYSISQLQELQQLVELELSSRKVTEADLLRASVVNDNPSAMQNLIKLWNENGIYFDIIHPPAYSYRRTYYKYNTSGDLNAVYRIDDDKEVFILNFPRLYAPEQEMSILTMSYVMNTEYDDAKALYNNMVYNMQDRFSERNIANFRICIMPSSFLIEREFE